MYKFAVKTLSTFFYIGYLPFLPGTYGSLAGVILSYPLKDNIFACTISALVLVSLGLLVTGRAEKIFNQKDARPIVIDEVAGMLLSLMFIPYDLKVVILAFILFRILDTLKPFPADRIQDLGGSIGIMGDDIIAGLYTNIILQIALRLASFKIS